MGEPNQLANNEYLKKMKARISSEAGLKSKLVCTFNNPFTVGLKPANITSAVANIASSKLLQKVLNKRKKCVHHFLNTMYGIDIQNGFGEAYHTASSEPYFYDQSYVMVKHTSPIPVDRDGRCVIEEEKEERDEETNRPYKWKYTFECKQCTTDEVECIVELKVLFQQPVEKLRKALNSIDKCKLSFKISGKKFSKLKKKFRHLKTKFK